MKHTMFLNGDHRTIDVNHEMKICKSIYILSAHDTPREKEDVIEFFMASSLEDAVRHAVLSDYFKENVEVKLITGDGQVYELTLDPKKGE